LRVEKEPKKKKSTTREKGKGREEGGKKNHPSSIKSHTHSGGRVGDLTKKEGKFY
jgi:hypothetical protein